MSGLRNVIMHRYMAVDELIYQFLQRSATDFETFSQHIVVIYKQTLTHNLH